MERNYEKSNKSRIHSNNQCDEESEFNLTWRHIANAISHELHHPLANSLYVIIKQHNMSDDDIYNPGRVQGILQRLRRELSISLRETQYIKGLIHRGQHKFQNTL